MKVKGIKMYLLDKHNYNENSYKGEVWFRIGLHKYYTEFITDIGNEHIPIAFLQSWGQKIPQDKKMQEKVLIAIYGELQRILGMWEVEAFLRKQEKKRKEEERKRKEIIKSLENVGNAMKNISETFEKALTSIAVSDIIKTMKGEGNNEKSIK